MNAVSNSSTDFFEVTVSGSDSDTNSDESPEYYQPISAEGDDEDEELSDHESGFHGLTNGFVENGIASLDLRGEDEEEETEAEAEEEMIEEATDSDIIRAFREDESRRNAPLPAENAMRVMDAMRTISFVGSAPDWAGRVPEDHWIEQVRRLRRPSAGITTTNLQ